MMRVAVCSCLLGLVVASAATAQAQGRRGRPAPPANPGSGAAGAAGTAPDAVTDAAAPDTSADTSPDTTPDAQDPAGEPAAGEPQTFPDEPVEATAEPEVMEISAARIKLSLNMFGDGSYALSREASGDLHQEFILGALGLLARGELSPSLAGVMELVFEIDEDGATVADLERLHITWKSPRFEAQAGRLHTPLGTWNDHYHHGLWLQLPVERPYVLRFEDDGGFLPIHWIGGLVTAHFDVGAGMRLNLTGGVGNGRGRIEDEILVAGDLDEAKAVIARVELEQPGERHWRAGLSGVFDVIAGQPADVRPALPDEDIFELLGNAFVNYRTEQLTVISEAYVVDHVIADQAWISADVFALAGYSLGSFTPYVLVEWVDFFGGPDPFFVPDPIMSPPLPTALIEGLAGVRIDLTTWAALKGELRVTHYTDAGVTTQGVTLNWAFGI
ncbi:MAG TPA: hypothetical protein VNM90_16245 [Haliangium sp.]|nr:hypothetical protein [Haliangium sp.]